MYAPINIASKYIKKKRKSLNSVISVKEIVFKIKTLSIKKTPGTPGFTGKLFLTLKERNIPILTNSFRL